MGQRIGGVLSFSADGNQYAIRANCQVSPSRVKREGQAGQTGVLGYTEMPVVPEIKGDFSTVPGLSLESLEAITNATVTAQLANGRTYVLTEAWTTSAFEIDTAEGKVSVTFQGMTCEEI